MWPFKPNVEKLKARQNLTGLLEALKFKKNALVREKAAQALGEIQNKNAVGPLIQALEDENVSVQIAAIHALGKIGDNTAVEPLIQYLNEDKQGSPSAIRVLGMLGDIRAIKPLLKKFSYYDKL